MGFNFGSIKTKVRAIITDLLADEGLATSISYKQDQGVAWNASLGRNVATVSTTTVSAIRTKHNRRSIQISSARLEEGDLVYFVKYDDMPTGMTLNDRIVEGTAEYRLKDITDLFGVAYILTVYGGA